MLNRINPMPSSDLFPFIRIVNAIKIHILSVLKKILFAEMKKLAFKNLNHNLRYEW